MGGLVYRSVVGMPVAVVDIETTGLQPSGDRIVEIAVVRVEPNQEPTLLLDTLVNPRRPVSATEIHGITDADVADAPTFEEVAGNLLEAVSGCVFAAYNVYFDAKFVQAELAQVGVDRVPPQLCLMYLRPMLGLGSKCSLADACQCYGLQHTSAHRAAADAMISARLWQIYTKTLESLGIRTFEQLAVRKAYKFTSSFTQEPLDASLWPALKPTARVKSRGSKPAPNLMLPKVADRQALVREYWNALTAALAHMEITHDEIQYLLAKRDSLKLTGDEVRWLHARAFAGILADVCQDKALTVSEAGVLHHVSNGLRELGWTPGDAADRMIGNSAV